jgi:hypothetical protein
VRVPVAPTNRTEILPDMTALEKLRVLYIEKGSVLVRNAGSNPLYPIASAQRPTTFCAHHQKIAKLSLYITISKNCTVLTRGINFVILEIKNEYFENILSEAPRCLLDKKTQRRRNRPSKRSQKANTDLACLVRQIEQ